MSSENEQENNSYHDTSSSIQQELPLFKPKAEGQSDGEKPRSLVIKKAPSFGEDTQEETPVTEQSSGGLLIKKSAPIEEQIPEEAVAEERPKASSPLILKSAETLAAEAEEEEEIINPIETGSFKDEFAADFSEDTQEDESYYDQLEDEFTEEEIVEESSVTSSPLILKSAETLAEEAEEKIEEGTTKASSPLILKSAETLAEESQAKQVEEVKAEESPTDESVEEENKEDATRLLLKQATSYIQEEEEKAQEEAVVAEEKTEEANEVNELIDDTLKAPKKVVTLQEFPRREVEDISDNFHLDAGQTIIPESKEVEEEEVTAFQTLDHSTVGEILAEAREQHEMSIDDVVQSTRIRHTYVNALENNVLEDLPEKVYTLGYIRQLCREYGIPHKQVTETYLKQRGEDLGSTHSQQTVSLEHDDVAKRASTPGGKITSVIIGVAVIAVLGFLAFAGYEKITQPEIESNVSIEQLEELDYSHFRLPIDLPLIKMEVPENN